MKVMALFCFEVKNLLITTENSLSIVKHLGEVPHSTIIFVKVTLLILTILLSITKEPIATLVPFFKAVLF